MTRSMIRSLRFAIAMVATSLLLATSAESSGHPDALAWFDVGYLVETYKQWIGQNLPHMTDGMRLDANPAAGVDGYALVKKALALRTSALHGDDPQMEFAAALITL